MTSTTAASEAGTSVARGYIDRKQNYPKRLRRIEVRPSVCSAWSSKISRRDTR